MAANTLELLQLFKRQGIAPLRGRRYAKADQYTAQRANDHQTETAKPASAHARSRSNFKKRRKQRRQANSNEITALTKAVGSRGFRSEEQTFELQSIMRISFTFFCLKKNTNHSLQ